uniref:BTB domain-containing protein n=1 Tax=Romanomermis culicivorax TaxID=13658 RepID=A0A915J6H7_ROMCU
MPTDVTLVATILRDRNKRTTDNILNDLKNLYRNFVCDEDDSISTRKSAMEPDVLLFFSNCTNINDNFVCSSDENSDPQKHAKFKCHSVILAARSPFFRNLIEKRCVESHNLCKKSNNGPKSISCNENAELLNIVLDETVIPRQYAPVILHAMYTDQVDLSLVIRGCVSNTSCLTEVQAIASGKCQVSPVSEATEIYHIAKFLEFDKLVEGCEDIIISCITIETLPSIYSWSNECYGSKFVRRFCVNFLCSEFVKVANSITLFDLEESILVETLRSDFLQASELEILNTIIKWGEHQLVKKIEEREPNILMGTTHSISRKGVRRSDLSDVELKEVLTELSPLIRTDFMLPISHPTFLNAQQRNLITRHGSSIKQPLTRTYSAPHGHTCICSTAVTPKITRPRLFRPYYEMARQLLEQRLTEQPEQLNALINLHPPLLSAPKCLSTPSPYRAISSLSRTSDRCYGGRWRTDEDEKSQISVEDQDFATSNQNVLEQIIERVCEVWQSKDVKRALACGCVFHRQLVVEQKWGLQCLGKVVWSSSL